MKVIDWTELASQRSNRRAAVTLGVFDGVHHGHRRLIDSVVRSDYPVVVTFRTPPAQWLFPDSFPGRLMSLDQRLEMFNALGIELAVLIEFNDEFASIPGDRFLDTLESSLDIDLISIGWNFRCGRRNDTSATDIRERFGSHRVLIHDPVLVDNLPVSSTRLRTLVLDGRYDEFQRLAGHDYVLDVRNEERTTIGNCMRVPLDDRGRLRASTQLIGPVGPDASGVGMRRHAIDVVVTPQYLQWPLVDNDMIDYIVVNEQREKEN